MLGLVGDWAGECLDWWMFWLVDIWAGGWLMDAWAVVDIWAGGWLC